MIEEERKKNLIETEENLKARKKNASMNYLIKSRQTILNNEIKIM